MPIGAYFLHKSEMTAGIFCASCRNTLEENMSASPKLAGASAHFGPARRLWSGPRAVFGRLRREESGTVAMLFGLSLIPLVAIIGLAVDFGRAYSVRAQTQSALDAAALAAAATAYFNQAKPKDVVSSTLQFSPNSDNTAFTVTANSWVRTPFLSVLKMLTLQGSQPGAPAGCQGNGFGCVSMTTTATAALCPSAACTSSGSGGSNVEVALMLDVTRSMCSPCSKIDAAKTAAKDLIDIVVWDDQTDYYSRVAIAPFAEAVNVGTTLAPLVRGTVTNNTSSSPQTFTTTAVLNDPTNQPTKKWIKYSKASGSGTNTWQISSKCVTERIGNDAYTDAAPAGTSTYVGKGYFGTDADTSCGVANHSDEAVNRILPLSRDKTALKAHIDKMETSGSTAGHLGTAWAWYLISPKWNSVLSQAFPTAYAAGPYSDLTTYNTRGQPKLRKIAVLMTDGEYNINYCKGVEALNSDQSPDIKCNSENGKSLTQATSLCTGMKNAKIEVFTVGFQVTSASKTFLTNCATDASHYYDATTEVALQAAFRDIALKIATLRLTN